MKILDTIQNLWSHCLFCPLCKDVCRTTTISSFNLNVKSWEKKDGLLYIDMEKYMPPSPKQKQIPNKLHKICNVIIDCVTNKIIMENPHNFVDVLNMHVVGICDQCTKSFSVGAFNIDLCDEQINDIELEKDGVDILLNEDDYYSITSVYYSNQILVSKCKLSDISSGAEVATLPWVDLDLKNPKNIIKKITTMLVLS